MRSFDRLFKSENPLEGPDFHENLNLDSLKVLDDAKLEPSLMGAQGGERYQFERMGYFFTDPIDSAWQKPIFNRIVTLKDTWAKIQKAGKANK